MKMKYILDRLLLLGSVYKRQHAIRPHEQPRNAQARMSANDALPVSSTIWSCFNSSGLGRHYEQYPDEYADADDEHGNGIYPTEPHGSPRSFKHPATMSDLYCKFETVIRANRDAFAAR